MKQTISTFKNGFSMSFSNGTSVLVNRDENTYIVWITTFNGIAVEVDGKTMHEHCNTDDVARILHAASQIRWNN